MCVQGGCLSRRVFFGCKRYIKLLKFLCPCFLAFIKRIGKTAPADIFRQYCLFFGCCHSAVKLQFLQKIDGIHVHTEFCFRTACTQIHILNEEVCLFVLRRFGFLGTDGLNDYIIREIVFLAWINSNRFRLECGVLFVLALFRLNISDRLTLICNREKSRIQIAFKGGSVNIYRFLFGYARQGVPNIVLVHTFKHHKGFLVFDCFGNKAVSNVINLSRRCCEDRVCRFHAFGALNIGKVFNSIVLFRKAKDLTAFLIETVKSSIPNTRNTSLVGMQTDGISVGSIGCHFLLDCLLDTLNIIPLLFLHKGTDIGGAFTSENRKSCLVLEREITQADLAALVVHRINLKLSVINGQLHSYGDVVFGFVLIDKLMCSVFTLAHQYKVLTVRPNLLAVMYPLICRKSRYRNTLATFKLFIQELAPKKLGNGLCILAVKLDVSVMLKSYKHRYLILLTNLLILGFACSIQHRQLFGSLCLCFIVCLRYFRFGDFRLGFLCNLGRSLYPFCDHVVIERIITEQGFKLLWIIAVGHQRKGLVTEHHRFGIDTVNFKLQAMNECAVTHFVVINGDFLCLRFLSDGNVQFRSSFLCFRIDTSGGHEQRECAVFIRHNIRIQALHPLISLVRFVYIPNNRGHIRYYIFKPCGIFKLFFNGFHRMKHIGSIGQGKRTFILLSCIEAVDTLCHNETLITGDSRIILIGQIPSRKDEFFHSVRRFAPCQKHIGSFLVSETSTGQTQSFGIVIGMAVISSAKSMRTTARSVLVFQKIRFFLIGVVMNKIGIGR